MHHKGMCITRVWVKVGRANSRPFAEKLTASRTRPPKLGSAPYLGQANKGLAEALESLAQLESSFFAPAKRKISGD
jgi:hypothetical protein